MLGTDRVFQLYDTTLRDGLQGEGMSLTVGDKLTVARLLDEFGVSVIEGGWPGAIPRDTEFFRRAQGELRLRNAALAAFGATRRPGVSVSADPQVAALLAAATPIVTLVAKSDVRHVEKVLRTSRGENLAMIGDTIAHLVKAGRRVFLDAEHFFDGYLVEPSYALDVVRVAAEAGAETVVLCDTNGGTLPDRVAEIVASVAATGAVLGVHFHDDGGCAVANTLAAVDAGVNQVQVTAHGYGERCGNANLFSVAANLALKKGLSVLDSTQLARMSEISKAIATITGIPARGAAPYVGESAFAHKAGLHASALRVDSTLYQHVRPSQVGNVRRTLVSDMAGRSSIELKAQELGYQLAAGSPEAARIADRVKAREGDGYLYESADASFEMLLREELAGHEHDEPFTINSWLVSVQQGEADVHPLNRAIITVTVAGERITMTGDGCSPLIALDNALRSGMLDFFPELNSLELVDCQSRILDAGPGTKSTARVLASFADGLGTWRTVGVGQDVVAASVEALRDAYRYSVLDTNAAPTESRARVLGGVR